MLAGQPELVPTFRNYLLTKVGVETIHSRRKFTDLVLVHELHNNRINSLKLCCQYIIQMFLPIAHDIKVILTSAKAVNLILGKCYIHRDRINAQ